MRELTPWISLGFFAFYALGLFWIVLTAHQGAELAHELLFGSNAPDSVSLWLRLQKSRQGPEHDSNTTKVVDADRWMDVHRPGYRGAVLADLAGHSLSNDRRGDTFQ